MSSSSVSVVPTTGTSDRTQPLYQQFKTETTETHQRLSNTAKSSFKLFPEELHIQYSSKSDSLLSSTLVEDSGSKEGHGTRSCSSNSSKTTTSAESNLDKFDSIDKVSDKWDTDVVITDTKELLEQRKNLMKDLKIDHNLYEQTINNSSHKKTDSNNLIDDHYTIIRIPLVTRKRAAKVKSVIENYYNCVDRYQCVTHFSEEDGKPKHPNVEGVFNPLQIIRNRRIRRKSNEAFKKIDGVVKFKLPSQVFSKHSKPRLIWQINLVEYIGDLEWRESHWFELKNANGDLWFPVSSSTSLSGTTSPVHRSEVLKTPIKSISSGGSRGLRMHEQLFAGFDGEFHKDKDKDDDETSIEDRHLNSFPRRNESSASLARQEPYKLNSFKKNSFTSAGGFNSSPPNTMTNGGLTTPIIRLETLGSLEERSSSAEISEKAAKSIDSNSYLLSTSSREMADPVTLSSNISSSFDDCFSDEMIELVKKVKKMDHELNLKNTKIDTFDSLLMKNVDQHCGKLSVRLAEFEQLRNRNDVLSQELITKIDEMDSNLENFSSSTITKSNKIEELLFYCDRTNGYINTSINLKIRNLIEKRDSLLNEDDKLPKTLLYNVLENSIVVLLWVVWVIVEAWRLIKGIFMFMWRLLKWIFF